MGEREEKTKGWPCEEAKGFEESCVEYEKKLKKAKDYYLNSACIAKVVAHTQDFLLSFSEANVM